MQAVGRQAHALFTRFCDPDGTANFTPPSFERDEVNLPSCSALHESGLEAYYGNVMMLMAEAWRAKVLAGYLRPGPYARTPHAALVTVEEESDGIVAGGIFVGELLRKGVPTGAALMIGIHRMPLHKLQRGRGAATSAPPPPSSLVNVTPALVTRVQRWCTVRRVTSLLVCPYDGSGLRARFEAMGFGPAAAQAPSDRFGEMDVRADVCEESALMVYAVPSADHGADTRNAERGRQLQSSSPDREGSYDAGDASCSG